jgi:hypothetical protein
VSAVQRGSRFVSLNHNIVRDAGYLGFYLGSLYSIPLLGECIALKKIINIFFSSDLQVEILVNNKSYTTLV